MEELRFPLEEPRFQERFSCEQRGELTGDKCLQSQGERPPQHPLHACLSRLGELYFGLEKDRMLDRRVDV